MYSTVGRIGLPFFINQADEGITMITATIELGHGKVGIGICTGKNQTGIFFEELQEAQPIGKLKNGAMPSTLGTRIYLILPDVKAIEVVESVLQQIKDKLTDEG